MLHVHRYHDAETLRLVKRARAAGTAVLWDNDDNLVAIPKGSPHYRDLGGLASLRTTTDLRRMVQAVDVVTTPSRRLAEIFEGFGARTAVVVENFVRDELVDVPRATRSGDGVVIGWLAGAEHQFDAERIPLRDAFTRLLDRHADVRLRTIGVSMGMKHDRYERIPSVPFVDLPRAMVDFDVGIAPLAEVPFNEARSNVKVKEYAVLGIPWLASAVGPYRDLGEREGGRQVADADGWLDALERLVTSGRERRKLGKRASRWGRKQTISRNLSHWVAVYDALLSR
ncbi:glycosyltransferase [Conexibacter arvalis]|uniref:Glycosyltransferase involved in cell wall biosynthesis n=1 Tax=Conexibacter arvalis TaxID=912552 RepID=A0A840I9N0_9ACTN|nr:glycosyltransferase involved in cell wall biosynthesis [Conexibacter arvalis]